MLLSHRPHRLIASRTVVVVDDASSRSDRVIFFARRFPPEVIKQNESCLNWQIFTYLDSSLLPLCQDTRTLAICKYSRAAFSFLTLEMLILRLKMHFCSLFSRVRLLFHEKITFHLICYSDSKNNAARWMCVFYFLPVAEWMGGWEMMTKLPKIGFIQQIQQRSVGIEPEILEFLSSLVREDSNFSF